MDVSPPLTKGVEKIIDPDALPLVEIYSTVITSPIKNTTPEATPGVRRSSRVRVQTKLDYIPSIPVKQYETANTQV